MELDRTIILVTRSDLTLKIEPKFKRGWLTTAQLALKRQEDYVQTWMAHH